MGLIDTLNAVKYVLIFLSALLCFYIACRVMFLAWFKSQQQCKKSDANDYLRKQPKENT